MPYFFYYLLKVTVCSAILFGYYHLFLRNKVYHAYNRFYLLSATLLSLAIPMLNFEFILNDTGSQSTRLLHAVNTGSEYLEEVFVYSHPAGISRNEWLLMGYGLLSFLLLVTMVKVWLHIYRLVKTHHAQSLNDVVFVSSREKGTPFSFFQYIFWNSDIDINSTTGRQIFAHELAHVREKHSLDKLYMNCLLIVFWINPVFWLIRKELSLIHEFIADKKAIADNDAGALAAMIVQSAYPQHSFMLTNHFFHSPIKRRLKMLTKYSNRKAGYLYRILALPVILFLIAVLTIKAKSGIAELVNPAEQKMDMLASPAPDMQDGSFSQTLIPSTRDTIPDLGTYQGQKINSISVKQKTQMVEVGLANGKKVVLSLAAAKKEGLMLPPPPPVEPPPAPVAPPPPPPPPLTFVLATDSMKYDMRHLDASQVMEIRAQELSVQKLALSELAAANSAQAIALREQQSILSGNPLYILEGKEMKTLEIKKLNPNAIKSITILKGQDAAGKYGIEKAANGVIEIELKKDAERVYLTEAEVKKQDEQLQLQEVRVAGYPTDNKVFVSLEQEPQFPGGSAAWKQFLMKNLDATLPLNEGWAEGQYTVIVRFIVNKDGTISDVVTDNYAGTKTAQSCINLIKSGPNWIPGKQNGRTVNAYKKQPITFVVSGQRPKTS